MPNCNGYSSVSLKKEELVNVVKLVRELRQLGIDFGVSEPLIQKCVVKK